MNNRQVQIPRVSATGYDGRMDQPRDAESGTPPRSVLDAYAIGDAELERVSSGHINATWFARLPAGSTIVLQRVSPIFPPETQLDIEAITQRLEGAGIVTTRLIRKPTGELFHEQNGEIWRALTFIEGETHQSLHDRHKAAEAGRILAEFHAAVGGMDYEFRSSRGNVHGLERHLASLRQALLRGDRHRDIESIRALANAVTRHADRLPAVDAHLVQVVHGDPKISNIVFEPGNSRAICLIDLDTVTRMPIVWELGDAFRSWCNTAAEDSPDAEFSIEFFEAAVHGYSSVNRRLLERAGPDAICAAIATLAVELAARFCADAIHESYFGWDPRRFGTASEHNQARTRAQLNLAASVAAQARKISGIVRLAASD